MRDLDGFCAVQGELSEFIVYPLILFGASFSILTKFDIKFLKNAWGFHRGVTKRTELQ